MKLPLPLFTLLLASLLASNNVKGETCDTTGCQGLVGYIFLPASGFERPWNFRVDGQTDCVAKEDNPFGGTSLPRVNASETIHVATKLFDEPKILEHLNEFQPDRAEHIGSGNACHVTWHQPDEGSGLSKATKVRILGYRTFTGHYTVVGSVRTVTFSQQLLFAMVIVEG